MIGRLEESDVHVWYLATDGIDASAVDRFVASLSADERRRHDTLVHARNRRDYAAAHGMIRRVLSLYEPIQPADWTFDVTTEGKPFVSPSHKRDLRFSLTHTDGLVACAVALNADVGVDAERSDRNADARVADRFFSPDEIGALRQLTTVERAIRFTEIWTLKEAYVKALGQGIAHTFNAFTVQIAGDDQIAVVDPAHGDPGGWTFKLFSPAPMFCLGVAVRGVEPPVKIALRPFELE